MKNTILMILFFTCCATAHANLWSPSEPTSTSGFVTDQVTVDAYSWPNTLTGGYAVTFGDNSAVRYFYFGYNTTIGENYTIRFYVIMDDNSEPVIADDTISGDFSITCDTQISTTVISKTLIGSGVYKVIARKTVTVGNTPGYFGVVKYTGQSTKGFKISGFSLELPHTVVSVDDTTYSYHVINCTVDQTGIHIPPGSTGIKLYNLTIYGCQSGINIEEDVDTKNILFENCTSDIIENGHTAGCECNYASTDGNPGLSADFKITKYSYAYGTGVFITGLHDAAGATDGFGTVLQPVSGLYIFDQNPAIGAHQPLDTNPQLIPLIGSKTKLYAYAATDGPDSGDGLLLESGTYFLILETGDYLLLE